MLLVAAYEIGEAIIERISLGSGPELTPLTFILIALTFPVNVLIFTLERRAARRLNSVILMADATHTQVDLYVTGSVLVSLVGVWLGFRWLDLVIATGVVLMILRAGFGILRDASAWLTDAAAVDPEEIEALVYTVPGVESMHRIRSRGTKDSAFVDLHVKVDPGLSTEQAHGIASEVEHRLRTEIPNVADALVHIEPSSEIWGNPLGEDGL